MSVNYALIADQDPGPGKHTWKSVGTADHDGTGAPGAIVAGTAFASSHLCTNGLTTNGGHVVDANTVAYWKLDEPLNQHQAYTSFAEVSAGPALTPLGTPSEYPVLQGGPNYAVDGQNCIYISDDHEPLSAGVASAAVQAACLSDWTCEAWVRVRSYTGGIQVIMDIGANGETEATNYIARLAYDTTTGTHVLNAFWESGAGVNHTVTSDPVTLNLDQWYHVAATCSESAGTSTITFYVDGVDVGGGSASSPTGGTSSIVFVGGTVTSVFLWSGGIADLRFSNVTRTPAEIAANASASDYRHVNDGSTLLHWRFTEAPESLDSGPYGWHLNASGNVTANAPEATSPLVQDGGRSRSDFGTDKPLQVPHRTEALNVFSGDGLDWTLNFWFAPPPAHDADVTLFGHGYPSGETLVTNDIMELTMLNPRTTRQLRIYTEHDAGVDAIYVTAELYPEAEAYDAHMITVVRRDQGDGTSLYDFYVNGVLKETSTVMINPNGGGAGQIHVGGVTTASSFEVTMDDVSLSNIARDASFILNEYQRGIGLV